MKFQSPYNEEVAIVKKRAAKSYCIEFQSPYNEEVAILSAIGVFAMVYVSIPI